MILSEFYLALMTRLLEDNDLGIEHFDLWNNQLNPPKDEEEIPFNIPAVFLEYRPVDWSTMGNKQQQAEVTFNLIVVSESLVETSSNETAADRNFGLQHLQLLDNIFAVLQGFGGDCFGSITRTGLNMDHNHDQLLVHVLSFRTRLIDKAAYGSENKSE